jgi:hypothetical protein
MRELIGKIPTKDSSVTKEVYLSELIRCRNCERTVPVGVEVVTVKRAGTSREVLSHECYCRAHGLEYEVRVQNRPISHRANA